ncbi:MAG: archaeal flagellar protein FlaJ [Methanolobus sp.]|jgi:flagellar protein FlaJ|uniref:type II secretion system F family protein n=1 Tax=unclassified Methanolobus TaxID=2629569 RepID=UPI002583CF87|nr:type II secretion system F family protein [Methanolobus sp.]MDK2832380.1 archaeal flagellar protein FlaJ [Methanolobus sp.]MDK2938509.1 archaeal flagellar protein FlaJ [Methanolobus sp.]
MDIIDSAAHLIFGKYVRRHIHRYEDQRLLIRKAGLGMLIEQYIAQTYFFSFIMALFAGFVGLLAGYYLLGNVRPYMLGVGTEIPWIWSNFHLLLSIGLAVLFAVIASSLTYYIFMSIPEVQANVRGTLINQSLPHTTAYLYAMSHGGGMNLIDIMKSLAQNYYIYGAAAEEVGYIVKDMEYYGTDLLQAFDRAGQRTPSKKFKDFLDGMTSIVTSGGDVSSYLKAKNDQYRLTATKEQKIFFETLSVLAEVYISAFVAGPLFLITILVVLGLVSSSSASILNLIVYLIIPIGTVIFLLLLNSLTNDNPKIPDFYVVEKKLDIFSHIPLKAGESDEEVKRKKMRNYARIVKFIDKVTHPLALFTNNPSHVLFITVPVSLVYLFYTVNEYINVANILYINSFNVLTVSIIDDQIFIALIILLVPFIIFDELRTYRVNQIENHIPDFLNNLASINEAGILLVDAIVMSMQLKIGILHSEVKRLVNDISWGAKLDDALKKFEFRIRTEMTRRIINLIIKANEATGDVKSVLAIAAHDADIQRQLKKERNAEMFVYIFIIYIAFMVFLFIVYILAAYFLPAMPASTEGAISGLSLSTAFDLDKYTLIFFHAAMIQGFCSGLVAGKMGGGTIHSGYKHSIMMMSIAYILFAFFI